ncbi:GNAT family N-acetyltransferase [Spirillospora sp. NPDC029432]|uniref:GNAT family N-acetyltransferase n=1 Tax=Spirillospora sp. NPDC029432 TaxID=3154599 RepID=UPI0034555EC1
MEIQDLEKAAALGWRAPRQERLGDWLLREAEGFTGRANSALAIGDPGLPLPAAVDTVTGWYASRGLPPMIAVPYPTGRPHGSELDRHLAARGWTIRSGAATVMTATPADLPAPPPLEAPATLRTAPEPDDDWLSLYAPAGPPPVAVHLLTSAPWQTFARIVHDGTTVAIGRVAGSTHWAGITAVEVHPAHRRRGLATAITAALSAHASDRGTKAIYLQVENDNPNARALYDHLGFKPHHAYHYRLAPATR